MPGIPSSLLTGDFNDDGKQEVAYVDPQVGLVLAFHGMAVSPITAVFNEAARSTTYDLLINNPGAAPVTIEWLGPNCGTWSPQGNSSVSTKAGQNPSMTWSHPHPPCPVGTHGEVTIVAVVSGSGVSFECRFQGAATGQGSPCIVSATH